MTSHSQARDRRRQRAGGGVLGTAGRLRSRRRRPVRRRRPRRACAGDANRAAIPTAWPTGSPRAECDAWMYTGALENYPDLVDRMATTAAAAGQLRRGTLARCAIRSILQAVLTRRRSGVSRNGRLRRAACRSTARGCARRIAAPAARACGGSTATRRSSGPSEQRRVPAIRRRRVRGGGVRVFADDGCQLLGVTRQLVGDARAGEAVAVRRLGRPARRRH